MTEVSVTEESAGVRIDRFVAEREEIGSRSHAARLIERGLVRVNGVAAKKSQILVADDVVTIELAQSRPVSHSEPAVPFAIAYEDEHLLVVEKPAGLVVHPAPGNPTGTLSQALAGVAAGGDPERPGIVHRLDKDTSGLLVVARSDEVLRRLQSALQAREVIRRYTALVRGRPESASGTIDAPLGRDRRNPENISLRGDSGREAVTHFEVVEELTLRTLLHVTLGTGRTHQIRVHLAAIGLPVCGDPQYGIEGDLGLTRQFLHASELSFRHPVTQLPMSFSSKLPRDLQAALERARQ